MTAQNIIFSPSCAIKEEGPFSSPFLGTAHSSGLSLELFFGTESLSTGVCSFIFCFTEGFSRITVIPERPSVKQKLKERTTTEKDSVPKNKSRDNPEL